MNTVISFFHLNRHCAILSLIAVGLLSNISCSQTHAQEEAATDAEASPLYVVRFIEVAPENVAEWRQAVKTKQQKFNSAKDSSKWGTWRIITGPRTNQFARGFLTTRELYSNPVHPVQGIAASWEMPEASYWLENISPLQESSGNQQLWRPIGGLWSTGIPHGTQARFAQHRRWRMKPGMYERLEANYKKLIATFDHLQLPIDFGIARLEDGGDFMIYAETLAYNDMADMPGIDRVREAFIDLHGKDEWKKFLAEHNAVMQHNAIVETETWMYEPDLSNLSPLPDSDHAKAKVQEHIDRVVSAFEKQNTDALMDEFVAKAIRSVSMSRGPVKGRKAITGSLLETFDGNVTPEKSTVEGEIIDARFVDPQTILAYGTFVVTNQNGDVVRSGKWGDVLRIEDGKAKFLLQSAYAERLDSMTAATFDVKEASAEEKASRDFQKVDSSIKRFTDAFNRGDVSKLTAEFAPDGVRIVSGLSGIHVGDNEIRKSFESKWSGEVDIASGSVLKASVLHTTPINSSLIAGTGIWWLASKDGEIIDGGYWGNVFRKSGDEVKLVMECAGSQSVTE